MKIAIVHDWLDTWGGSEKVLAELLDLFPDSDLFALVDFLSPEDRPRIPREMIRTSLMQQFPFARRHFRKYLSLMPFAMEQLDLQPYDLVISSCHAASKSVLTGPDQLHICVCYSPPRYAWDMQPQYLMQSGLERGIAGWLARRSLHRFRLADLRASAGVDVFVAISHYVARRIAKCYRRDSTVIYPPVDIPPVMSRPIRGTDYITVSRIVPYKRVDLLVDAFRSLPDRTLHVVGDGEGLRQLRARATSNVVFHGAVDDAERDRLLDAARAFLFAAEEDFGIAPIEAQARGVPVIAFARGGASETIQGLDRSTPTGVHFEHQVPESVIAAVNAFEENEERFDPAACRANAERFAAPRFRREIQNLVETAWSDFQRRGAT